MAYFYAVQSNDSTFRPNVTKRQSELKRLQPAPVSQHQTGDKQASPGSAGSEPAQKHGGSQVRRSLSHRNRTIASRGGSGSGNNEAVTRLINIGRKRNNTGVALPRNGVQK